MEDKWVLSRADLASLLEPTLSTSQEAQERFGQTTQSCVSVFLIILCSVWAQGAAFQQWPSRPQWAAPAGVFFFFLNCAKSPLSGNLPQQACRTHPFRNVFFSPECTLLSGHPSYSQPIYVKVKLPSKSRGCILKCIQSPSQKTKRPSPRKHHPHFEVLRCTYCCADMEMRILVFELPGLTNSLQTGSKCFVLLTQSLGYKWALITHMFSHCYLA